MSFGNELSTEDNHYDIRSLNCLMDEGIIDGAEQGFMKGYLEGG